MGSGLGDQVVWFGVVWCGDGDDDDDDEILRGGAQTCGGSDGGGVERAGIANGQVQIMGVEEGLGIGEAGGECR